MRSFKASNDVRERVVHIVENQPPAQNLDMPSMQGYPLRVWASRVGRAAMEDVLTVYFSPHKANVIRKRLEGAVLSTRELAINGHDVLATGVEPKQVGVVLQQALNKVLQDPSNNTKECLLKQT